MAKQISENEGGPFTSFYKANLHHAAKGDKYHEWFEKHPEDLDRNLNIYDIGHKGKTSLYAQDSDEKKSKTAKSYRPTMRQTIKARNESRQLIRITEEDLNKMVENSVRRALKEGNINEYGFKDGMKDLGKFALAGGIGTAALATDNPLSRGIDRQFADQEQMGRASQVDRDEMERNRYLDGLEKDGIDTKTISWNDANQFENKIVSKAITESINNFVNDVIKKSEE